MFTNSPLLNNSTDEQQASKKKTYGGDQYAQLIDADDASSSTPYHALPENDHKKNAYVADLFYTAPVKPVQNKNTVSSQSTPSTLIHSAYANNQLEQPLSLPLNVVITGTDLANADSGLQAANIVTAFNAKVKTSALTTTKMWGRGERLDPSEFMLVHRNKVAEIAMFNKHKLATVITGPGTTIETIGKFQQNAPFLGAHGSFLVNVPQGKYAKVWRGNRPVLLSEGPHVIHDATFKFTGSTFNPATDFIDQNPSTNYIQHGSLNIVRVPTGEVAKITINGKPYLLPDREEPYAFNVQNFQLAGFAKQSEQHISHGNIHIIRVPQGKFAKVTVDGATQLLKPRIEPYFFNTPYFVWDNFVDQTANYIGYGNKHILRVPPGHVGKVTADGVPHLLESRPEPYEFDTLYFQLEGKKQADGSVLCFEDSTQRLIKNGNLKRLIPRTGEVAVTYDNGKLKIIEPSDDQKPIMIESATHVVNEEFLPIGIKTLIFPSEETKKEKKKDNSKATEDEIAYEVFTTKDSLRIGVKLMVAYEISNAALAMSRLVSMQGILEHIENCAVVDMGKAIQGCSSQEFLSFYQTKPTNNNIKQPDDGRPSAPLQQHFQDEVKNQLSSDLAEYGIKLVRLNIETPKVLDESIAKQMGSQSIATAQASATEANLAVKYNIARQQANQDAEVKRIERDQMNAGLVSEARAKFDAFQLNETAQIAAQEAVQEKANLIAISKAKNDLEVARLKAEVVKTSSEAENEQVRLLGQRYHDYPELLQIELAKIQYAALAQTKPVVNLNVTSEEMRNLSQMTMNPFMMFANGAVRSTGLQTTFPASTPAPISPRSQQMFANSHTAPSAMAKQASDSVNDHTPKEVSFSTLRQ